MAIKRRERRIGSTYAFDLNDKNIEGLFSVCYPTDSTEKVFKVLLQSKQFGYEKDSDPIYLDSKQILKHSQEIDYLYGQLLSVHEKTNSLSSSNADKKYNGEQWTQNKGTLMKFFYLGLANSSIAPFASVKNGKDYASIFHPRVQPTLSPKDPEYPEWIKLFDEKIKAQASKTTEDTSR